MRLKIACIALVAAPCACATSQVTAPAPLRSGVYPLHAYNGKPLPVDIGILGPKGVPGDTIPRDPGGCHVLVTAGSLTLDVQVMRYSFGYETRNACNQALLSQTGADGAFEQRGDDLVFHMERVDGDRTFGGSVSPSSVTLDIGRLLEFQR